MTTINPSTDQQNDACAVDRSCADSGCGCSAPTGSDSPPPATSRRGLKAGLLAAACAVGCLAVPLAVGGAATVSGAIAGEWWLLVGLTVAALVVGVAVSRRRRTGSFC